MIFWRNRFKRKKNSKMSMITFLSIVRDRGKSSLQPLSIFKIMIAKPSYKNWISLPNKKMIKK